MKTKIASAVLAERGGVTAPRERRVRRCALAVSYVVTALLVGLYMRSAPAEVCAVAGLVIVAAGCVFAFLDRTSALILVPAAVITSPITRVSTTFRGSANMADLFVIAVLACILVKWRTRVGSPKVAVALLAMILLIAFSAIGSIDMGGTALGLIGLAEYGMLAWAVGRPRIEEIETIVWSWTVPIGLASALMIWGYYTNHLLWLGVDDSMQRHLLDMKNQGFAHFRARYFTATFSYLLGVGVLLGGIASLRVGEDTARTLTGVTVALLSLWALILSGTKTYLYAAVVCVLFYAALTFVRITKRHAVIGILALFAVIGAAGVGGAGLLEKVMGGTQAQFFLRHHTDMLTMNIRLAVWGKVAAMLGDNPQAIALGLGPESTVRSGGAGPLAALYYTGYSYERALDNAYLAAAVEYGIPMVALCTVWLARLFCRLWRSMPPRPTRHVHAVVVVALVYFAMSTMTQPLPVTKPVWLVVELLMSACALVYWRRASVAQSRALALSLLMSDAVIPFANSRGPEMISGARV